MAKKKEPKRDACYKHVSKYMPKNSAYRSGHMVKCRNAGGPSNYRMGGSRQKNLRVVLLQYVGKALL